MHSLGEKRAKLCGLKEKSPKTQVDSTLTHTYICDNNFSDVAATIKVLPLAGNAFPFQG